MPVCWSATICFGRIPRGWRPAITSPIAIGLSTERPECTGLHYSPRPRFSATPRPSWAMSLACSGRPRAIRGRYSNSLPACETVFPRSTSGSTLPARWSSAGLNDTHQTGRWQCSGGTTWGSVCRLSSKNDLKPGGVRRVHRQRLTGVEARPHRRGLRQAEMARSGLGASSRRRLFPSRFEHSRRASFRRHPLEEPGGPRPHLGAVRRGQPHGCAAAHTQGRRHPGGLGGVSGAPGHVRSIEQRPH